MTKPNIQINKITNTNNSSQGNQKPPQVSGEIRNTTGGIIKNTTVSETVPPPKPPKGR